MSNERAGGSLPAVNCMDRVETAPLLSVTVSVALYTAALESVTCASGSLIVFVYPFLEVIFQEYFKGSPSASLVPFDERLTVKGSEPTGLSDDISIAGFRLPPLYSMRSSSSQY